MQLKTIGESLNVVKTIETTLKATSELTNICGGGAVQAQKLALALKGYSIEAVKTAISQSTLNEEQIKAILYQQGLTGETLETTAAELAQVTSTNALSASQTKATLTTNNLGLAMKGLGSKITAFLKTPAGFATIAVASILTIKSAYDKYQEHLQKVIDKGQEAQESIKSYTDELSNTKSTIDNAIQSYEKLADGVDLLTNKNISLSDEEYKEFIDTNNTLAEMFPELISGLDNEGNKILNLGNNADTAKSKLDELYEAQQKLIASEINDKLPDVFSGIYQEQKENLDNLFIEKNKVNETLVANEVDKLFNDSNSIANIQSLINQYGDIQGVIDSGINLKKEFEDFDFSFSGEATEQTMLELSSIQDLVEELTGEKIEIVTSVDANGIKNAELDLNSLSSNDILDVYSYITQGLDGSNKELFDSNIIRNALVNSFKQGIEDSKNEINENYKKQVPNILKVLESNEDYYSDNKQLIDALVSNFDYSAVADEISKKYDGDIVSYLNENLLSGFNNLSKEDSKKVQDYYNNLLSIDSKDTLDNNLKTINDYVEKISKLTKTDKNDILESFGLNDYKDVNDKIDASIKKIAKSDDELSLLKNTTSNLTLEQSKLWLSSTEGCKTATESITAYNNALKEASLDYTVSFDPSTAFESMKAALEEQSNQGYLTEETLTSLKSTYGDLSDILTYTANGIQLNAEKMQELTKLNAEAALVNTQLKEAVAVNEREKETKTLNKLILSQIKANKTDKDGKKIGYQLANARNKGSDALRQYISANKDLLGTTYDSIDAQINKIDSLNEEINGYDALEQSIYATISALADYKNAKETANSSDNYNYVQSEIDTNETAFKNGWTQTDEFKEWMNYIGQFNEKLSYSDEEIQTYIDRAKRYFTEDISGLFNFLDDASEKSDGLISKLTDGSYDINVDDISALAENMDMSISSVTDIMLAMKDADGFNIDFSNISESLMTGLNSLPKKEEDARKSLEDFYDAIQKLKDAGYDTTELEQQYNTVLSDVKPELAVQMEIDEMSADELSKKAESYVHGLNKKIDDVEINLESDDIDDLQNQLTAINDYRANLDVNTEDYKHATIVATELLRTKQKLTDSKIDVLDVDTSQYTDKIQTAISTIQQYNDALNSLEEAKLGGDTSKIDEAQQKVNTLKSTMDTLQSDGTFATIDFTFNAETFKQDIANINVNSLAKDTEITPSVDLSDVESGSKKAKSILENTKPKIKPTVDTSALHNNIQNAINSQPIRISNFDLSGVRMGTGSYNKLMEVPDTKSIGNNSFSELYTKATQSVRGSAPSRVSHYRNTSSSNRVNGNNGSSSTDSANEFLEVMDWIEVKIQRCEERIERLDKVANNTFTSWTNRTSKLNSEIAATADEIKWATAGYQEYLAKAESINLSEEYKQKVREGRIQIEDIKDENLRNAISDYQEWYENAVQLSDSIEELNQQLSELQKMKFDNLIQQFEDMQSIPSNIVSQIDELISLAEARGRVISRRYYQIQYRQEVRNNNSLVQERNRLQDSLNEAVDTGRITRGSEAWYEMYNAIQDVNRAIIESNTNLAEYANSMRQVDWDLFDLTREKVENLSSEIEFMTSLLSDEKLTDGSLDRGLTKYGIAQIGQYATMYNIAMAQAQDYADEINKIEKELQNDPANQDLINRKQELVEAQQQAIQSANDEKQAMIDLAREGYDAVLDRMQELINKRNEALDAEKDLYDYQKSIAEKTKNIAELQKQLSVYTNDNSEEAKKRIQQIQVELENAQQDLEDTEYDRYISDQKDLLDDLYNDYSDKIDEKFENTDNIIKEYIGITNENTSQINRTLRDVASEVGYNMSTELKKIWNSSTNTNSVVATFNNDFKTHSTSVLASLERIDGLIRNYYRVANNEANSQVSNIGDNSTTGVSPNLVTTSDGSVRIVLPTNGTANLVPITKFDTNLLQPITDTFKYITPNSIGNGNLSINIENINLDNVTDAKEFSSSLVNAIQTDKKVFGALESKLINPLVGKSTKKVNKY